MTHHCFRFLFKNRVVDAKYKLDNFIYVLITRTDLLLNCVTQVVSL
jgi:hypothetical protein